MSAANYYIFPLQRDPSQIWLFKRSNKLYVIYLLYEIFGETFMYKSQENKYTRSRLNMNLWKTCRFEKYENSFDLKFWHVLIRKENDFGQVIKGGNIIFLVCLEKRASVVLSTNENSKRHIYNSRKWRA